MLNETIAAVSTPRGRGGIAVIRISGEESREVLRKCFKPMYKAPWDAPRLACYGSVMNGDEVIDNAIATFFAGSASFTGEDSAEISCHGGTAVTAAVLEAVLRAGAKPAGAGEFTRRAFVNGKLSLDEAEAVGRLIDADTDSRRRLSSNAARGSLSRATENIRSELRGVLAALYAVIDYPDEDIGGEGEERILGVLQRSVGELEKLLSTYRTGSAVCDGVVCAIVGTPNSGKSSLYNLLCRSDKAIVTDVAGTTRDTLWETVDAAGITLRIADTAGIRDTEDKVESMGIDRAVSVMENAELIIAVIDGSTPLDEGETSLLDKISDVSCAKIAVVNKKDLGCMADTDRIESIFDKVVPMCAKSGEGLEDLYSAVGDIYNSDGLSLDNDAILWNSRHKACVENAVSMLRDAISGLLAGDYADAVCTLAESALSELSMLDGRGVSEEIVSEIFARFCVGK